MRYTRASESLLVKPVERSDSNVMTFVKAEKINFSAKNDPAPRIISPRDPRFNVAIGRFIKPIEGVLYGLLNDMCGGRTVMKGLNSFETGAAVAEAWHSFSEPVAIGLDAKRFDQHTRTEALKFEQLVYKLFFDGHDREELARLLRWQLESKCTAYCVDGIVRFKMNIRASGDMNTGLGTCLIACALVYSFCKDNDMRFRLINNGDDCVLLCERSDLPTIDGLFEHCHRAGYWMEIEKPVYQIEHLSFCQTRPVLTSRGYTMVREFPVSIGKDLLSILPLDSESMWKKWAHDVGNCGRAINSGVPVLQSFYTSLARAGSGTLGVHPWIRNSGFFRMAVGLRPDTTPVTHAARVSFWEAFGVSPDYQQLLEEYYDHKTYCLDPCLGNYLENYNIDILSAKKHYISNHLFNQNPHPHHN
jgi:hypothetical protein